MRAIVVEDSRLARSGLIRMLRDFNAVSVVGEAENPKAARALIEAEQPDLLFLDIHMPGESGFELLASLNYSPKVIFTTAYADYAIESFEYNTIDYLLKPISTERLTAAINKLGSQTSEPSHEAPTPLASQAETLPKTLSSTSQIFIKDGDQCHLVKVMDIQYIESCKNYVQLYFSGQKAFVKKSLNQVEERLPEQLFFRANRQFMVNLQAIARIETAVGDGYELTMHGGIQIEVSRRNATRLKELLSL